MPIISPTSTVNNMKGAAVPAGAIERWDAIPLSVPPTLSPTTLSRLVDLSYCVRVSIETISAVFPVFIGSVRSESISKEGQLPEYFDIFGLDGPLH